MFLPSLHSPETMCLLAEVVPLTSEAEAIGMTTGLGLPKVKFSDLQPDISSITQDRRFLTARVMLPSPYNLGGGLMRAGYHGGGDLAKQQYLLVWLLHQGWQDINFQVDRLACGKTYAAGQWLWQGGYNGFVAPIQTYGVDNLGACNKELADLRLADLPAGYCLCPSLR